MNILRRAKDRGHADHGWLDTSYTFSFADYHDPQHMGFRSLRVINEDRIAPGAGFGTHPHRDMEIISVVLAGELQHRDSLNNGAILRPGEVQRITAGRGVLHSEFNPSPTEPVHLYQIWILPRARGLDPGWEQKRFDPAQRVNRWQLIASPDGADESLVIQQDTRLYLGNLSEGTSLRYELVPGRHAWLQIIKGIVEVEDLTLHPSDGLAVSQEQTLSVKAKTNAEVMLFDLN